MIEELEIAAARARLLHLAALHGIEMTEVEAEEGAFRAVLSAGPGEELFFLVVPAGGGYVTLSLVLVVDGDPAERTQMVLMLKSAGYRVIEAESAEEAAVLLEEEDHAPKLLVTDVVLPGIPGTDLADQLGSRFHELQVIYTSNLERQVIVSCGDLNPDSPFVAKPCSEDALLTTVRRLLDTPTS